MAHVFIGLLALSYIYVRLFNPALRRLWFPSESVTWISILLDRTEPSHSQSSHQAQLDSARPHYEIRTVTAVCFRTADANK